MAYGTDIDSLSPDHHWSMDGALADSQGSATLTNTGCVFTDTGICEDASACMTSNAVTDRIPKQAYLPAR